MLPAPHGVGAYVQVGCEERLTSVERLPDVTNLFRGDRLRPRRNARDAQVHSLAALVGRRIPKRGQRARNYLQDGNLNEAMRVCQLNVPFTVRYSVVYQKVQSSTGSIAMLL